MASTGNKLDAQRTDDELVAISHKVPRRDANYVRMLAIQTGREQRDLLAEGIALLRKKHGDI